MNSAEKLAQLQEVKSLAKRGESSAALDALRAVMTPGDDFVMQTRYSRLFETLDHGSLGLQKIRIAVLGSSTLDHFTGIFRLWLSCEGFLADLYLPPFDSVRQTVLDRQSGLYRFEPELVWLFSTFRDVSIDVLAGGSHEAVADSIRAAVAESTGLWKTLTQRISTFIIQNNADLPSERVFGNYEGACHWSRTNMLRRYNLELAEAVEPGVTIFDLDHVASVYGRSRWHDPRLWILSKHAFTLDASGHLAFNAARLVAAIRGRSKKCIVVDLDNTLWGGVIGDEGLDGIRLGYGADGEAFVAFQEYLLSLKNRGILLTVCSKNEMDVAQEPFRNHPDMRLRLNDITVFRANWDNKADNIREIASILNIGLDALVFVDDNPAERELVRRALPMVTVPEMPQDPADYVSALDGLRLFETISFSEEDKVRHLLYRDNAVRREFEQQFSDLSEYLNSLDMEAEVGRCNGFSLKRMAQLINKSNQFHLTGTRYSESKLERLNCDPNHTVLYFTLKDRFGDNGLISAVIINRDQDTYVIDTWVMSCRVLSRGMEEFICKEIISLAQLDGCVRLLGRYVPSKKNHLVAGLYERLKFLKCQEDEDGTTWWELIVNGDQIHHETCIRRGYSGGTEVCGS